MARVLAGLCLALLLLVDGRAALALRIAVLSDLNSSYGSTDYEEDVADAVAWIIGHDIDLVLVTGDMVAGQQESPLLNESQLRAMWEGFHQTVTDPLTAAGIPVAVTPGNHDASAYAAFSAERHEYAQQWAAHRPDVGFVDDRGYPFDYAFAVGDVLLISLDATLVGPLSPEQHAWLENLLAGNAAAYSTVIAFSHVPLWPFAQGRETQVLKDPVLEGLFREYGVDLHLTGHHHAFYPGMKDGVLYVSQGALGQGPRSLVGDDAAPIKSFTLIETDAQGITDLLALLAPDFDAAVGLESLPDHLDTPSGPLVRMDLVGGR